MIITINENSTNIKLHKIEIYNIPTLNVVSTFMVNDLYIGLSLSHDDAVNFINNFSIPSLYNHVIKMLGGEEVDENSVDLSVEITNG